MSDTPFARVRQLFDQAADLDPAARRAFLDQQCAGGSALRARLERMLEAHGPSASFLREPAAQVDLAGISRVIDPMLGTTFGHYTIHDVLGRGGMGIVYRAEQDRPRRTVALKLIRVSSLAPSMLRRFEHEAQILARLQHPSIAQIYEAGTAPGFDGNPQPFFAMELVRGRSLLDYVRASGLTTRDRLCLFVHVCSGVQHAHQRGVIHRDLKPGNILIDEGPDAQRLDATTGEGRKAVSPSSIRASVPMGLPKILDFGVARVTDPDEAVTTMQTSAGQVIGTLQYMSPEQARGESDKVDVRSDIYALGVVLYELLSGKLPYDVSKRPVTEAARIIAEQDATMLHTVDRSFRGDIETIVRKAMEKEPHRRYQSVAELSGDIERFLTDRPIVARPASTMYHIGKFARRNKVLVGGVAAVMLALLAGVIGTGAGLIKARRAEATAQREAQEARTQAARATRTLDFVQHVLSASDVRNTGGKGWSMSDLLGELAARADAELGDDPKVACAIDNMIGASYIAISDFDRAQVFVERAEKRSRETFGEGSAEHAQSVLSQAQIARARNDFQNATALNRQALDMVEALPQSTARDRAVATASLAEVLQVKEPAEAARLLREAIELVGMDRANAKLRLDMRTILGEVVWLQGQTAQAEDIIRQTLAESREAYGNEHPDVALTCMSLARTLQHGGKAAEALPLLREANAIFQRVYPSGHRLHSMALEGLAYALAESNQVDEAEPLARQYLEEIEASASATPRDLLRAISLQSIIALRRKDFATEEPLRIRQVELSRKINGEQHYATRELTLALAQCYINQKKVDAAGEILRPLLDLALDEHPDAARFDALLMIARWFEIADDPANAEATLARAVHLAETSPPSPTKHLQVTRRYSTWLEHQNRMEEAEAALVKLSESLLARFGADHISVKNIARDLAAIRTRRAPSATKTDAESNK